MALSAYYQREIVSFLIGFTSIASSDWRVSPFAIVGAPTDRVACSRSGKISRKAILVSASQLI